MGFLGKLGKIALAAAPYVAAPFTGGASLLATGATNKALGAWNAKDAQSNAAKGLGPSKFDNIIGKISGAGDLVTSLRGGGSKLPGGGVTIPGETVTKAGGGWKDTLGKILGGGNKIDPYDIMSDSPSKGGISGTLPRSSLVATESQRAEEKANLDRLLGLGGGVLGSIFGGGNGSSSGSSNPRSPDSGSYTPGGVYKAPAVNQTKPMRGLGPVMGQRNQSSPNLAESIGAGRQDAIMNQPYRRGYETRTQGPDDTVITQRQPRIKVGRNR